MSTQAQSLNAPNPPPLETFDAESFRRELAGLTDPDYSADDNAAAREHKSAGVELCLCLCELFGESLDRTALWHRIASALTTSVAKADGGDMDRLITLALEHVKADPAQAARHERLAAILVDWTTRPLAWRQGLIRWIATRSFALIAHARLAWEQVKHEGRMDRE